MPRLKYELAQIPPQARAIDLLHKAIFRTGLGNSIFCAKHNVGKISSETLAQFVTSTYTYNRIAITGMGISHQDAVNFAQGLSLQSGEGPTDKATSASGEIRKDKGGALAHVAIGTVGGCLSNTKEALAYAVLKHALGTGPSVRWGGSSSILHKALGGAAGDKPFAVSALNACYSDAGLFGVMVSAPADSIGKLVCEAAKVLKSGSVAEDAVKKGKAQLKLALLATMESESKYVEDVAHQVLLTGQVLSPSELTAAVDSISSQDVSAVAKKVGSGKLSLAAVGNLANVPYLDSL